MYGTDVLTLEDGAHHYEIGSHLDIDGDENYNEYVPTREVTAILGAAGTVFMSDPFGIHLGRRPEHKPRLLIVARYS
jgi:hypothetical protein